MKLLPCREWTSVGGESVGSDQKSPTLFPPTLPTGWLRRGVGPTSEGICFVKITHPTAVFDYNALLKREKTLLLSEKRKR